MWITETQDRLSCGYAITLPQARALRLALNYQRLLARCPEIFASSPQLVTLYSRIDCAYIPTELEHEVAMAQMDALWILCDEEIDGDY